MNSDEIQVRVKYDITYDCGGIISNETRIEDYKLNAFDYSPNKHYLYASGTGLEGEKRDSIPIWVISFEIDEENVTKYFNPYKPDSARIKYRLEPPDYANPDISPNPISMKVEIKDKDGLLVYGPRDLTLPEQRNQLLWWNGVDNSGDTVKVEKGPFKVEISLKYKEGSSTSSSFSPTTSSVLASATKTLDGKATDEVDVSAITVTIEDEGDRNSSDYFVFDCNEGVTDESKKKKIDVYYKINAPEGTEVSSVRLIIKDEKKKKFILKI